MLWNRNHPQASDGARQDPPILQPGQNVYIPPIRMLEKYHPAEIPESAAASPPASVPPPPSAPPVGLDVPRAPAGVPVAATPSLPARPAPAAPEKSYRVRGNGEMFYNIAVRTLGSGDRWMEIFNLNKRYDPSQPIPAGTVLQLPKDARVEPADAP
jgi:nucleoid-associated protein YgaU